jgi:hypothetical protein
MTKVMTAPQDDGSGKAAAVPVLIAGAMLVKFGYGAPD